MTVDAQAAPRPVLDDADTGEFFAGFADGELRIQFCCDCDATVHLPQARCRACGSWNTEWRAVSPAGAVYSWTVVERQVHPAFPVPYTLVLIDLDEAPGARLVGRLPGRPGVTAGTPVRAKFDDMALPTWEVLNTGASDARGDR